MVKIDDADQTNPELDDAMAEALRLYRHLTECEGLDPAAAAHALIGCAFFAIGQDLALDQALEELETVREMLDQRIAELCSGRN